MKNYISTLPTPTGDAKTNNNYMIFKFVSNDDFQKITSLDSNEPLSLTYIPWDPSTSPLNPICFAQDTPVMTDQGEIFIQDIQPGINTINGEEVIAISRTVHPDEYLVKLEKDCISKDVPSRETIMSPQHKILYNGKLVKAYEHPSVEYPGKNMLKNEGQVLYNVLTKDYSTMMVNNMVVETLDPEHQMAVLYKCLQRASVKERNETLNKVGKYQRLSIKN
jgi:hypothetical protein